MDGTERGSLLLSFFLVWIKSFDVLILKTAKKFNHKRHALNVYIISLFPHNIFWLGI